jgi:two-component system CheB/CheR fusion protein
MSLRSPYLRRDPSPGVDDPSASATVGEEEVLRHVFRRLRTTHGVDFTHYKRGTIRRRLARRMA